MYYKIIIKNIESIPIISIISNISKFYITITNNFNEVNYLTIYLISKKKKKLIELSKLNNQIIISTIYNKVIHKLIKLYFTPNINNIFIDYSFYNINNIIIYNLLNIKDYLKLCNFNKTIINTISNFINNLNNKIFYIFNSNSNFLLLIQKCLLYFNNNIIEINNNNENYDNLLMQKINNSNNVYFIISNSYLIHPCNNYYKNIYNTLLKLKLKFNLLILSNYINY
jgi:hypothetical protein